MSKFVMQPQKIEKNDGRRPPPSLGSLSCQDGTEFGVSDAYKRVQAGCRKDGFEEKPAGVSRKVRPSVLLPPPTALFRETAPARRTDSPRDDGDR